MLEMKLRGFVTPEDFEGSDGERIQKALDTAKKEDICKVVLTGTYHAEKPLVIPNGMHLVFDGAVLHGTLQNQVVKNFSLISECVYIEGKNGELVGDMNLCHVHRLALENMKICGDLHLDFCINFRLENLEIAGSLTFGRGCQNAIVQNVQSRSLFLSGEKQEEDVLGREPVIKNLAVRDSRVADGICLQAEEDCALINVQIDHVELEKGGVVIGKEGQTLPKEQYLNMTLDAIEAPESIRFFNETLHTYLG